MGRTDLPETAQPVWGRGSSTGGQLAASPPRLSLESQLGSRVAGTLVTKMGVGQALHLPNQSQQGDPLVPHTHLLQPCASAGCTSAGAQKRLGWGCWAGDTEPKPGQGQDSEAAVCQLLSSGDPEHWLLAGRNSSPTSEGVGDSETDSGLSWAVRQGPLCSYSLSRRSAPHRRQPFLF